MTDTPEINLPSVEEFFGEPLPGSVPASVPKDPPQPLDKRAELKEYGDLLAFIAAQKDAETSVEHLSTDEFANGLDDPLAD